MCIKYHALLILFTDVSNGYKMNDFSTIKQMTLLDRWVKKVQTGWFLLRSLGHENHDK